MNIAKFDLDLARSVLAAQPFSNLLGARLAAFGRDQGAVLEIPIREDLRQQFGYVHGGVLSYAADNALTYAGATVLGPNVLTGGFTITYLRPADGKLLSAEARVVGATRRQAVCECSIYAVPESGDPVLCAVAQGTIRAVDRDLPGTDAPEPGPGIADA
ncbi:PaaI family thioesterase [Nocardia stercoris]|uniref:Medium/long-chain acyl-CoA thioesterase YigI n=1 Tax=Nocardia stercoris TaxID=2483361 RepID=A0A3M2LA20_9NOCA|nr:PaaI family thioesterase [Nocardia stercoris]RMI34417.1 PaaI family thioesterase [Nocardia stercoris]